MDNEITLGNRRAKRFCDRASDSEIDAIIEEAIELLSGDNFLTHSGYNTPPEERTKSNVFYGPYSAQTEDGVWVFPTDNNRDKGPDGKFYTEDDILTQRAVRFTANGGISRAMWNVAYEVQDEELESIVAMWKEAGKEYPYRNQPHLIISTLGFYYHAGLTKRMFGYHKYGYYNRRAMRAWQSSAEMRNQDAVLSRLDDALHGRGLTIRNTPDLANFKMSLIS